MLNFETNIKVYTIYFFHALTDLTAQAKEIPDDTLFFVWSCFCAGIAIGLALRGWELCTSDRCYHFLDLHFHTQS
jgi:hypothetical protein